MEQVFRTLDLDFANMHSLTMANKYSEIETPIDGDEIARWKMRDKLSLGGNRES